MKKLLSLLLTIALLICALPALGDAQGLTREEITAWQTSLLRDALLDNHYTVTEQNGVYELQFAYYTLETDTKTLGANSSILSMTMDDIPELNNTPADIRGLRPGDTVDALLAAWPNDNPTFSGTREEAVLYLTGSLPGQASVGLLSRNGPDALEITHLCFYTATDGVHVASVIYTLDYGVVVSSYTDFSGEVLTLADARAELDVYAALRATDEYTASLSIALGDDADIFNRDDLVFSDLDFLTLTPESAALVLGDEYAEEWLEDGDAYIHVMEWNAASVTFLHDADRRLVAVDSLFMDEDTLVGPRGLRIGETMDTALSRFRYEATDLNANPVAIYGTENDENYAAMESYLSGSAEIRYYCTTETGEAVMLRLYIENGLLSNLVLQML